MTADDDIISMFIIIIIIIVILIIIILFIIIIMMMVMRMMTMMEIMMLEAPICESVLQFLDMIIPKPKFRSSQEHLLLSGTRESGPPEVPTWAIGDPSSCMISNYILDNEVSRPADSPFEPQ